MASMRNWLKDPTAIKDGRVVVVHCKAGKGRSGTVACSYLISEEGWKKEDALSRFTERRMRQGFGAGVSIPSQLRWVGYVDRWTKHGKLYVERQVEILEVHIWGLRDGVKVAVEGFVNEGQTIKTFHVFTKSERLVVDGSTELDRVSTPSTRSKDISNESMKPTKESSQPTKDMSPDDMASSTAAAAVIFRPSTRIVLPTSDVCLDFERRNRATYGWTMVTAVAHVWFNAYFESSGPENAGTAASSGVFEIDWDAMDGIKGSSRKGTRALDKLAVVWRAVEPPNGALTQIVTEPPMGEPVPEGKPADWAGAQDADSDGSDDEEKAAKKRKDSSKGRLGLRVESPASASISKASSIHNPNDKPQTDAPVDDSSDEEFSGLQPHIPASSTPPHEGHTSHTTARSHPSHFPQLAESHDVRHAQANASVVEHAPAMSHDAPVVEEMSSDGLKRVGLGTVAGIVSGMRTVATEELPGGVPEEEMAGRRERALGSVERGKFVES